MVNKNEYCISLLGKKYTKEFPYGVSRDDIQGALDMAFTGIAQSCYIQNVIADTEMILCREFLEKRGYFRFAVKKYFTEAQNDLRRAIKVCESCFNSEYYNDIATSRYEMIKPDLVQWYKLLAQKISNLGYKNPGASAWLILINNVVNESASDYDLVMRDVYNKFNIDLSKDYLDTCPLAAYSLTERLQNELIGKKTIKEMNISIAQNKDVVKLYHKIVNKTIDIKNIVKSRKAAYYSQDEGWQKKYIMSDTGVLISKNPYEKN